MEIRWFLASRVSQIIAKHKGSKLDWIMTIIIEARCETQFAVLLSIYKRLKIQFKIFFVLSILLMAAPLSFHFGLVGLITTVIIGGSNMVYLCIQQQHAIDRMQSALYNICLKSMARSQSETKTNFPNFKFLPN